MPEGALRLRDGARSPGSRSRPRPSAAPACTGDCDADGVVTINELVNGVNIVLGRCRHRGVPGLRPRRRRRRHGRRADRRRARDTATAARPRRRRASVRAVVSDATPRRPRRRRAATSTASSAPSPAPAMRSTTATAATRSIPRSTFRSTSTSTATAGRSSWTGTTCCCGGSTATGRSRRSWASRSSRPSPSTARWPRTRRCTTPATSSSTREGRLYLAGDHVPVGLPRRHRRPRLHHRRHGGVRQRRRRRPGAEGQADHAVSASCPTRSVASTSATSTRTSCATSMRQGMITTVAGTGVRGLFGRRWPRAQRAGHRPVAH